jgi:hypothetical protein
MDGRGEEGEEEQEWKGRWAEFIIRVKHRGQACTMPDVTGNIHCHTDVSLRGHKLLSTPTQRARSTPGTRMRSDIRRLQNVWLPENRADLTSGQKYHLFIADVLQKIKIA